MTRTLRFRASSYDAKLTQAAHAHDHLQISLVLSGVLRESVCGREVTAGALSVVVKDAGVRHADRFGDQGVSIAQLSLPSGALRDLIDCDARAMAWYWSHDIAAARPFLRVAMRAAAGAHEFSSDDADILDLLAIISSRHVAMAPEDPPRWLSDAVEELRATWRSGTRVRDVAARVGVHPVYLARCFRRWYGHGVSDELRRLRQRASFEAMLTERTTLSAIAHDVGYSDESHLNRDVRAWSGSAPGQLRRALRRLPLNHVAAKKVAPIQV